MTVFEFHPACLLLPKMLDDEYQALRDSVRSGYDNNKPIELFDGKILDGRHRYQACNDEKIEPRFITLIDIDPYDYVRKVHEGRRSWSNQVQKALVIGELMKRSDEFQAIRQQVKDEANRKRAEARAEQAPPNPTGIGGKSGKTVDDVGLLVVPQTLAPPTISINQQPLNQAQKVLVIGEALKQSDEWKSYQENRKPVEKPRPPFSYPAVQSPPKQPERTTAVVAAKIGVNRGAIEQAQTIQEKRPDLADKVKSGEMKPGEALRQIKKDQVAEKVGALQQFPVSLFRPLLNRVIGSFMIAQ